MVLASKETMTVAHGSASSALTPATSLTITTKVLVSPQEAVTAVEDSTISQAFEDHFRSVLDTALEEEEPEVYMDEAVTSALEGISLALSMDNPL